MKALAANETKLVGRWLFNHGEVDADDVALRIEHLIHNALARRGATPDGWTVLYQDPADGRFWELTYPQAETHGGRPPQLTLVDSQDAKTKYKLT